MTLHRAIAKTAAEEALAAQFASLANPSSESAVAFARFAAKGLPTRRDEAWHYTDLRAALAKVAPLASAPSAEKIEAARRALAGRPKIGDVRLVFLDGHFIAALSDAAPAGLSAHPLEAALSPACDDSVVALNVSFARGGLALSVRQGVVLAERVEIAHGVSDSEARSLYSRVDISLGAGAKANVVESFFGAGDGAQRNAMTSLRLGEGARCDFVTSIEDDCALNVHSQFARLAANSEFNAFALVTGGQFTRRQLFVGHDGPGAKIGLSGLSLLAGKRLADTTLVVEHCAPGGQSREYFKHIVADEAVGVYQGKVIVKQAAQKTDGGMKSQAILLSPAAQMNNKPELEIFADDVVCGHGATVGALDPEHIFYLQARGIPAAEAEAMLLEAFGADAIDRVEDETVAEFLRERMRAWLGARA